MSHIETEIIYVKFTAQSLSHQMTTFTVTKKASGAVRSVIGKGLQIAKFCMEQRNFVTQTWQIIVTVLA